MLQWASAAAPQGRDIGGATSHQHWHEQWAKPGSWAAAQSRSLTPMYTSYFGYSHRTWWGQVTGPFLMREFGRRCRMRQSDVAWWCCCGCWCWFVLPLLVCCCFAVKGLYSRNAFIFIFFYYLFFLTSECEKKTMLWKWKVTLCPPSPTRWSSQLRRREGFLCVIEKWNILALTLFWFLSFANIMQIGFIHYLWSPELV